MLRRQKNTICYSTNEINFLQTRWSYYVAHGAEMFSNPYATKTLANRLKHLRPTNNLRAKKNARNHTKQHSAPTTTILYRTDETAWCKHQQTYMSWHTRPNFPRTLTWPKLWQTGRNTCEQQLFATKTTPEAIPNNRLHRQTPLNWHLKRNHMSMIANTKKLLFDSRGPTFLEPPHDQNSRKPAKTINLQSTHNIFAKKKKR